MGFFIVIHAIACVGLIFFILIQSGKGGGLVESFSSAESIFGTKTNTLVTKITTTFAVTFFITCLVLAFFSVQQSKSIVQQNINKLPKAEKIDKKTIDKETKPAKEEQKETQTTNQENNAANQNAAQTAQ